MRPSVPAFAILFTFVALLCVAPAVGQQADADRFELRGIVINAATGEPVSGALVQMHAPEKKVQFPGTNGTFGFTNLLRGQYFITVKKPGFFSKQELGHWNGGMNSLQDVPSNGEAVLKLTPEGIIYGEVKNENGEPIEGVTVRAQVWHMENGQRRLQDAGDGVTDDEGNFRIAELIPARFYLSFLPVNRGSWVTYRELNSKNGPNQGYGSQFYPGVADAASASAILIHAGAQIHIVQTLSRQHLFEVAGVIRGANPESGFSLTLMNTAGDAVQKSVRIDARTGEFQIQGIPPGTYMLWATAQELDKYGEQEEYRPPLSARLPIHLNSDLTGVVLTLGRGISVGVQVHDEIPHDGSTNGPHQVEVRMASKEFPQFSPSIVLPPRQGDRRGPARFEELPPGSYTVEATPYLPGYVASLQCGNIDLLRDDLTVAPGAALPPIEVTLRNDGAQLSVTVTETGQPAGVVVYSEEYPRRSLLVQTNDMGTFSLGDLAPGRYRVLAVKDAQNLEFRNPAAMEKYLDHASAVILQPGDKASIRVEVQDPQEQQQ